MTASTWTCGGVARRYSRARSSRSRTTSSTLSMPNASVVPIVATMHAMLAAANVKFPGERIARLAQRAENNYVGTQCGILDQLTCASGVEDHALLLDCSTLAVTPVRVPDDIDIVVVHSGEARTLAGSAYAQRRAELESGMARRVRHVRTAARLRDAPSRALRVRCRQANVRELHGPLLHRADARRHQGRCDQVLQFA